MNEQMDLLAPELTEQDIFEMLLPKLQEVLKQNNMNPNSLELKRVKNFSSVYFTTALVFRIFSRNGSHYFGISSAFAHSISDYIRPEAQYKKRDGFIHIGFEPTEKGVLCLTDMLCSLLDTAIDSIPKEFDCCSRFEECSNARKCINPSSELALGCGYRKIMKSGRIYYGKNRNIG